MIVQIFFIISAVYSILHTLSLLIMVFSGKDYCFHAGERFTSVIFLSSSYQVWFWSQGMF